MNKKKLDYFLVLIVVLMFCFLMVLTHFHNKGKQVDYFFQEEASEEQLDTTSLNKTSLFEEDVYLDVDQPILYIEGDHKSLCLDVSLNQEGIELFQTDNYSPYYYLNVSIRDHQGNYFYQSDEILWDITKDISYHLELNDISIEQIEYVLDEIASSDDSIVLELDIYTYDGDSSIVSFLTIDCHNESITQKTR